MTHELRHKLSPEEKEKIFRDLLEKYSQETLGQENEFFVASTLALNVVPPLSAYVMCRSVDRQEALMDRQEASMQRQEALMKDMHRQSKVMTWLTVAVVVLTIFVMGLAAVQVWSTLRAPGSPSSEAASVLPATQPAQLEGP